MLNKKPENVCPLWCDGEGALCKAHLLPRFVYLPLFRDDATLKMYSDNTFSKKVPEGVYDKNILCRTCDRAIGDWDDSFSRLNNDIISAADNSGFNRLPAIFQHSKPDELKLFGLSLLYRFAMSNMKLAQEVNIGPFFQRLHTMVINRTPGDIDDFSMFIAHEMKRSKAFIVNPSKSAFKEFNGYKFFLPYCTVVIKVDKRPLPSVLHQFAIGQSRSIEVLVDDRENPKREQLNKEFFLKALKINRIWS